MCDRVTRDLSSVDGKTQNGGWWVAFKIWRGGGV